MEECDVRPLCIPNASTQGRNKGLINPREKAEIVVTKMFCINPI